ncbi:AAA family ATPase [Terricaulis silvestris]|uniref:AAA family ATPase n=1 Tax=Terricaulis silvestris TaxID=2686094 RepID=UPI00131BAB01|nr:AAA family ATPase [Terricaulis silvestris]
MIDAASRQRARTRARRARSGAGVSPYAPSETPFPANALDIEGEAEFVPERSSAPVLSLVSTPPLERAADFDAEEETEFVLQTPALGDEPAPNVLVLGDSGEDELPPFDPPDVEDLLGVAEPELEDDAPFDPPETLEEFVRAASVASAPLVDDEAQRPANENTAPRPLSRRPAEDQRPHAPTPPISVHISWDRGHSGELAGALASDRRMARADISHERGGLDGAIVRFAAQQSPDLLIIDTTLSGLAMFRALERLTGLLDAKTKLVIIGAVNDVGLFRELAARGVSEYVLTPASPEQLVDVACRLFAETDSSHVIAVIGARGGVGASTIARNLAWSIAEEHEIAAALVDLDWSFGTAAFEAQIETPRSIADALAQPDDEGAPDRVAVQCGERLRILSAPASLQKEDHLDPEHVETLIRRVRRLSSFVVLDLPHTWAPWVKQALVAADDIVMVASPDLASLRNAEAILRAVKSERAGRAEPIVALSMVGVPKRPEITLKDFAEALNIAPVESLAFDPALFGAAVIKGQMLAEVAPRSKGAVSIAKLASLITGREPVQRARIAKPPSIPQEEPPISTDGIASEGSEEIAAEQAPLELVEPAPPIADYIVKARQAAEAELITPTRRREDPEEEFRFPIGLVKVAACVGALGFGAFWYAQSEGEVVATIEPASAAAVILPAPQSANDLPLRYETALQLIDQGDQAEGIALLQEAADENFAPAQHRLAQMYAAGEGVAADPALARQWTERAAAAGNVRAMHDLGVYFARAERAPADEAAAFRWFRQAAELNLADSQFNLGILYQQGRGVNASAEEALFWFMLAARQGDEGAAERAAQLEAQLPAAQVEQALARAQAFSPREVNARANVAPDVVEAATEAPAGEATPG